MQSFNPLNFINTFVNESEAYQKICKKETSKVQGQTVNSQKIAIYDQNDHQMHKKPLYFMPRSIIPTQNAKIFNPSHWSVYDFQIARPLGSGKFGHVYLAREAKSKHIVALKVLSKKQIINNQIINQVRRQMEIHTHLKHPNILGMYGFFYDEKRLYYILEYANGGQLYKKFIKQGKFCEQVSSDYISQVAKALKHMHAMNVIHRDIKPENILISEDQNGYQTLKIADFGWSIHAPNTKRRTMCGTPDYLCPEVVEGRPHDGRVDIWSLGVLAYQLNAGFPPFQSQNRAQLFTKIKKVKVNYPAHFSKELIDFLGSVFKRNPENRMGIQAILQHKWLSMYRKPRLTFQLENNQRLSFGQSVIIRRIGM